jgi:hypothetical protein
VLAERKTSQCVPTARSMRDSSPPVRRKMVQARKPPDPAVQRLVAAVAVPACHGLRHASAAAAGRKERNNDERRPKHTLMIGRLPVIAIRRRP